MAERVLADGSLAASLPFRTGWEPRSLREVACSPHQRTCLKMGVSPPTPLT